MPVLPIAERKKWGLILVPKKRRPFCVMSKIGHNSPAYSAIVFKTIPITHSCINSYFSITII